MSETSISQSSVAYSTPMSFLDTSTNASANRLTGDANFACTAQNLGIVTGLTTFTQCVAPLSAPVTTSSVIDTTPTFTGVCLPNTLVTLYNGATALTPNTLCTIGGTYSITPTLSPASYTITAKQSNRKGATFGTSVASASLSHTIGCTSGLAWNGTTCMSTCTTTEAPSELKANMDKPYINCTNGAQGTHFKYKISNPNDIAFTPILSDIYSVGTRVLHDGVLGAGVVEIIDTSFDPGTGVNDYIKALSLQTDGKILIG